MVDYDAIDYVQAERHYATLPLSALRSYQEITQSQIPMADGQALVHLQRVEDLLANEIFRKAFTQAKETSWSVSGALAALDRLDGDPADRKLISSTILHLEGRIKCVKEGCPNDVTPGYILCANCAAKRGNI